MIDEFKSGYYYKFIGNENDYGWYDNMNLVLDRKWHKCIYTKYKKKTYAYTRFEGMKKGYFWFYRDFIEAKYSPELKIKKLLKEIK